MWMIYIGFIAQGLGLSVFGLGAAWAVTQSDWLLAMSMAVVAVALVRWGSRQTDKLDDDTTSDSSPQDEAPVSERKTLIGGDPRLLAEALQHRVTAVLDQIEGEGWPSVWVEFRKLGPGAELNDLLGCVWPNRSANVPMLDLRHASGSGSVDQLRELEELIARGEQMLSRRRPENSQGATED